MFQKHAQQIHDWDESLTVNADRIVELHDSLDAVQADHNRWAVKNLVNTPRGRRNLCLTQIHCYV